MDSNNDILAFQEKIKRHLSDEYLFIVEKKDDLENQLLHLQTEKEKKNKTLFPGFDQKDIRKYFSPLNLKEPEYEDIDEKDKQISLDIERVENDIRKISQKMSEIKEIIYEIDDISEIYQKLQDSTISNRSSVEDNQVQNYEADDFRENHFIEDDYREDHYDEENQKNDVSSDISFNDSDSLTKIYPQMLRNLYEFSDSLKEKYAGLEVLIEFSDNNLETPVGINRCIIKQIDYNIEETVRTFHISGVLIQGEITSKKIYININYVCDNEDVDSMNVIYEYTNV